MDHLAVERAQARMLAEQNELRLNRIQNLKTTKSGLMHKYKKEGLTFEDKNLLDKAMSELIQEQITKKRSHSSY